LEKVVVLINEVMEFGHFVVLPFEGSTGVEFLPFTNLVSEAAYSNRA